MSKDKPGAQQGGSGDSLNGNAKGESSDNNGKALNVQLVLDEDTDLVRLETLFKKLDHDGDGRINVTDLAIALKRRGVDNPKSQATQILSEGDTDESGDITLEEFINYAKNHEKKLKLIFKNIDRNRDGKLDLDEIVQVCKEQLGIEFKNENEVKDMIRRYSIFLNRALVIVNLIKVLFLKRIQEDRRCGLVCDRNKLSRESA